MDSGLKEIIDSDGVEIENDVTGGKKYVLAKLPTRRKLIVGYFHDKPEESVLWVEPVQFDSPMGSDGRMLLKRNVDLVDCMNMRAIFQTGN